MGSTQNFIPTATTKIYKWKTSHKTNGGGGGEAIGLYQEPTVHRCNLAIAAGSFFLYFKSLPYVSGSSPHLVSISLVTAERDKETNPSGSIN